MLSWADSTTTQGPRAPRHTPRSIYKRQQERPPKRVKLAPATKRYAVCGALSHGRTDTNLSGRCVCCLVVCTSRVGARATLDKCVRYFLGTHHTCGVCWGCMCKRDNNSSRHPPHNATEPCKHKRAQPQHHSPSLSLDCNNSRSQHRAIQQKTTNTHSNLQSKPWTACNGRFFRSQQGG